MDEVKDEYEDKKFFEEKYNPEKFEFKLDKNGRIMFDAKGEPIKKERGFFGVPQIIKEGFKKATTLFEGNIPVSSLPNTSMPNRNLFTKAPNTNLTRTESALLSDPLEREIARKT